MNKGVVLLLAFLLLAASVVLGVCMGASSLEAGPLLAALRTGEETTALRILRYVRLPRVVGAVLAGSALAVSGTVLQSVLGNPLASPNIIGVNAGAGFFVLLASALFPYRSGLLPVAAFGGALLAALLVLAVSAGNGFSSITVVLAGFAVSSIFSAGMNAILLVYPDAYVGSGNFLAGGLSALTAAGLKIPALYISAGITAAMALSRGMNILALGADAAKSLGMRVNLCRLLLLAVAAVLAGAAVSFAGMVGFVGLVAPHTARFLIGQDNRYVAPLSALLGAAFVVLCDVLSRVLFAPYELPVGILMSLAGGPFFLYLLLRNRRRLYD